MTQLIGHNTSAEQLRSIIARIEKLTEEKDAIAADIRDVFAEAAGNGFDKKALRQVLKLRQQDEGERNEQQAVLDLYLSHLGMLPLFETPTE